MLSFASQSINLDKRYSMKEAAKVLGIDTKTLTRKLHALDITPEKSSIDGRRRLLTGAQLRLISDAFSSEEQRMSDIPLAPGMEAAIRQILVSQVKPEPSLPLKLEPDRNMSVREADLSKRIDRLESLILSIAEHLGVKPDRSFEKKESD